MSNKLHPDPGNLATLRRGETRVVNGKLWCRCADCGKVGRVDGWLGGLHLCLDEGSR